MPRIEIKIVIQTKWFFRSPFVFFFILLAPVGCYENKAELDELENLEIPDLGIYQSMAIFSGKIFFVTPVEDKLICDIYRISERKRDAHILLDYSGYPIPHANVSCFGNKYNSETSIAPLLYVSSWNNQRQAFVYDIKNEQGKYESSLVQVIDPSGVREKIIGEGYLDWVVDAEGGFLYSIAYHLKNADGVIEGNFTHITKFRLPDIEESIVKLSNADVQDYFRLPVMNMSQDKDFVNGHIFVVAGKPDASNLYPPRFFDIDVEKKELNEYLIPLVGEPEGFCFYEGRRLMNMYGSSFIYNLNRLIAF